jgi:hypothetical protein
MYQPTIEKLHALRMGVMADALSAQLRQPEVDAIPFQERLALLVDIQHSAMLNAALEQRLRRAGMRQSACMENLDLRTPRGLDRSSVATQIPLDRWHEQIGDPTYADAILDRLVHNAHRFEMKGESMRRRAARSSTDDGAVDKIDEQSKYLRIVIPVIRTIHRRPPHQHQEAVRI